MADHPVPSDRARELVRGAVDYHVHIAPDFAERRITDIELARRCLEPGLAGFGLKSHYTRPHERAAVVAEAVPGVTVLGTITLNRAVGGLNALAVEVAAREGARSCGFRPSARSTSSTRCCRPTRTATCRSGRASSSSLRAAGAGARAGAGRRRRRRAAARRARGARRGRPPRDGPRHRPPFARRDLHARRRRGRGGRRARSSSRTPSSRRSASAPTDQVALAERGALLERAFTTAYTGKCDVGAFFEATRAVGAERTLWSTDLGQVFNPPVEDGLALMADRFLAAGFSEEEVVTMAVDEHAADRGCRVMPARAGHRRPLGRLRLARRRGDRECVAAGGDRRGHRALLRRARRVRRAVEAGGPDRRERQAPAPRRGGARRGPPRRELSLPRPRRLPAADRRRRGAGDRRRDPRVRARTCWSPIPTPIRSTPTTRSRTAAVDRARALAAGAGVRARSRRSGRRRCSCSSPTSPSCATSCRPRPVDITVGVGAQARGDGRDEGAGHLQTYYAERGEHRGNHARRASGDQDVRYGEAFLRVIPQVVDEL